MAVRAYNDMSYVDLDVKCIIVLENKFVKNKCHKNTELSNKVCIIMSNKKIEKTVELF